MPGDIYCMHYTLGNVIFNILRNWKGRLHREKYLNNLTLRISMVISGQLHT